MPALSALISSFEIALRPSPNFECLILYEAQTANAARITKA